MKHLKPFNENLKHEFTQEDLNDIRDVFQDIIDEYNIEPNNDDEFESAVSYNIIYVTEEKNCEGMKYYHFPIRNSPINFTTHRNLSKYKKILIRIYLPINIENRKISKYEHQDKLLKDAQDFNKRLNIMGYNSTIFQSNIPDDFPTNSKDIIQAITIHIPTGF